MADVFVWALWRQASIVIGAAVTTELATTASHRHGLNETASVALGRLLTCTALMRFIQPRTGTMSLQVTCTGPLRQLFADVDPHGNLRGYCRGATDVSALRFAGRLRLAPALKGGMLSVIRAQTDEEFTQSSVEMPVAEIDADLAHYAAVSEQTRTLVHCVERPHVCGGVIAQCLPDADMAAFNQLAAQLEGRTWEDLAAADPKTPQAWLKALVPEATHGGMQPLNWQCRCSLERVLSALNLLSQDEIAAMISAKESATVTCDFCREVYCITPTELQQIAAARSRAS